MKEYVAAWDQIAAWRLRGASVFCALVSLKPRSFRTLRDSLRGRIGFYVMRMAPREDIASLVRRIRAYGLGAPLICIGGNGNGGYLIPDDLAGVEYCFLPTQAKKASAPRAVLARMRRSLWAMAAREWGRRLRGEAPRRVPIAEYLRPANGDFCETNKARQCEANLPSSA